MRKLYTVLIPLSFLILVEVSAQKIKYKDVFPLLEAKNYDAAKPQLDLFLKNPKNAEHPNANLQKGLYFEQLVNGYALIADSTALLSAADSASIYLSKSKTLITEKELKKNDEYYQAFYRRDLRTGNFGIKISDVHLDIEKKVASLKKLKENAGKVYQNLDVANRNYQWSNENFKRLSTLFASENDFYLMAGEDELTDLQTFIDRQDSITTAYEELRDAVSRLSKKGYSPEIEFMDIENFQEDGKTPTDFYQNDIKAWNYSDWADNALRKIRREITAMKGSLLTTYQDLKSQEERIKLGENIMYEDLTQSIDERLTDQLRQFDEDPLPEKLLSIMLEKNRYDYITNRRLNQKIEDTEDVSYQLAIHDSLTNTIGNISSSLNEISEPVINRGFERYKDFLQEAYGGDFGLIKYRNRLQQQFEVATQRWKEGYEEWLERSHWAVSEDLTDSIYLLSRGDSSYQTIPFAKYYTIAFSEGDSSHLFVIGLEFQGAGDQGFVARVANSRTILWKENFKLGKFKYSDYEFLVSGGFVETEENKLTAYIFSDVEGSENNFIILNANLDGGLNWTNELKTANRPVDIKFNDIIKETIVYLVSEEELGVDEEEPGYIVIDRTGKVR